VLSCESTEAGAHCSYTGRTKISVPSKKIRSQYVLARFRFLVRRRSTVEVERRSSSGPHVQEADMEDGALFRVGAVVENPPVQQHVLCPVDVHIDGVAAHTHT